MSPCGLHTLDEEIFKKYSSARPLFIREVQVGDRVGWDVSGLGLCVASAPRQDIARMSYVLY